MAKIHTVQKWRHIHERVPVLPVPLKRGKNERHAVNSETINEGRHSFTYLFHPNPPEAKKAAEKYITCVDLVFHANF